MRGMHACINVADARVRVRIERRLATQALAMQQDQGTRAERGLEKSTQHKLVQAVSC